MSSAAGRVVYVNGRYVPEAEAGVSIFDSALMYGDMVFEMTRSFNRRQFKLREHLERLYRSIKGLQIPFTLGIDELESLVHEVIRLNQPHMDSDDEDRVLINVSRGPMSIYHPIFGGDPGPTLIISSFPLSLTLGAIGHLYERGVHAVIPAQRAIPADLLDPKNKNRSRLAYMVANLQVSMVHDADAWALLLDPDGFVTEGTGANFFIVSQGVLISPEPRNILRGISRAYVMELARELGIEVCEKNIGEYDVVHADEAFYTATPFSILPCTKINGVTIGSGRKPITAKLLATWSERVGVDIVAQAQRYGSRTALAANQGANPYRMAAPSVVVHQHSAEGDNGG